MLPLTWVRLSMLVSLVRGPAGEGRRPGWSGSETYRLFLAGAGSGLRGADAPGGRPRPWPVAPYVRASGRRPLTPRAPGWWPLTLWASEVRLRETFTLGLSRTIGTPLLLARFTDL